MKIKKHPRLIYCSIASSFFMLATMSHAVTTLVSPNRYTVTEGVAFTLGNISASHFTFNWTDPGLNGVSFAGIEDPTLVLTLGQTYTFQRISDFHPFVIMDNTAADFIDGSDGTFFRTSTSASDISGATLTPVEDFTANPGTPGNTISWTPTEVGDFWYTCTVTSHTAMTGKITVIPEPSTIALLAGGFAFAALRRRRRFA